MMSRVVESLLEAMKRVVSNKGAAGPDRQTIEDVKKHGREILRNLSGALLDGSYRPGDIRRAWIPKSGGGQRGLGIPNVVDQVVQEAVREVLEPLYEPRFHDEPRVSTESRLSDSNRRSAKAPRRGIRLGSGLGLGEVL
jgi:retron-type reverse transcriptase